jgi:hypothetical protein
MNEEHDTRLWMGGVEVKFLKWAPPPETKGISE